MLVLQRKKNQALRIGDDIEIIITDIKGDTVKIGIRAPKSVTILRKEIYDSIQEQNIAAAKPKPEDLDKMTEWMQKKKK